ncbi:PUA-like domain-containing protein [Schizophyllum fasciatum]
MPDAPDIHALARAVRCPLCAARLDGPLALRCGHSVCAVHIDAAADPAAAACPVPGCRSAPSSPAAGPSVQVFPAPPPPPVAAPAPRHLGDVTVNKILALLERHSHGEVGGGNDDSDDDDYPPPYAARHDARRRRRSRSRDDEPDLLSHLSQCASAQRATRPDSVIPDARHIDDRPAPRWAKELLSELTCEICFQLFYEPITTPCQHTFCTKCLQRSLDHSPACPICRQELPGFAYFQDHPVNQTVMAIIRLTHKDLYDARAAAIEQEEKDGRLDTPIFVCQLAFPGMPTLLHFFEPRYRLMLRRCLASPNKSFGMITPPRPSSSSSSSGSPAAARQPPAAAAVPHPTSHEYGTMLEIRSVQMLPDGRSMVETWGTHRFRILERGVLDGYMVGRVERIDDVEEDFSRDGLELSPTIPTMPSSTPPLSQLVHTCLDFIATLRKGTAPWVVQRLSSTYGPMPSPRTHVSDFSFWMGLVLPIGDEEKARLLPVRSVRMRLVMCCWWIEGLRASWWFSSGCVVL